MLRNGGREGLSADPAELRTGGNSGHMALNIAVLAGATRIVLLGYDGKEGAAQKQHWFGNHPDRSAPAYQDMVRNMRGIAAPLAKSGVRVINASPGSAIDCFPKASLEEALAGL